jgi:hypothetical protein
VAVETEEPEVEGEQLCTLHLIQFLVLVLQFQLVVEEAVPARRQRALLVVQLVLMEYLHLAVVEVAAMLVAFQV